VGLLHAAHRGDAVAEEAAVAFHARYAHLQQIVEASRYHVALHHLIVREHHLLEALEGIGRRAIEQHLDVGEEPEPEPRGVQSREVPLDVSGALETPHPLECRRHGEMHLTRELRHRRPPVLLQPREEPAVDAVEPAAGARGGGW